MLNIEDIIRTGYYIIVDDTVDNTIQIVVGESMTDGSVDTIKIVFNEKGFIKLYVNNDQNHKIIRECKDLDTFKQCCYTYIETLRSRCQISENLVYKKKENKLVNYFGDSNE